MKPTWTGNRFVAGAAGLAAAVLMGACSASLGRPGESVSVDTVPTKPHLVSGGDALVRIDLPASADAADVSVEVNGAGVAEAFRAIPATDRLGRSQHALLGLVTGLEEGDNTVAVKMDGQTALELTVTNYPVSGPIFSGEHLEPYFCLEDVAAPRDGQAQRFAIGNGEFITGGKLDDDCSLPTRVDYVYRSTGDERGFRPLPDPSSPPADVAQATTSDGQTVPFIVRLETGTINRAIYQIAILADPRQPRPDLWNPPAGWNGRLVYTYGGGCEAGFFQGTSTGGVLRENVLAKGYAIASSTLNVNAQGGCNDPLSAETTMMVKEHFAETFGPPVHTIGSGGSGGAMQQLLIAGAYPGILDGVLPSLTYPDAVTYLIDTEDCRMPILSYADARQDALTEDEKRVIGGWGLWETCNQAYRNRTNRIGPDDCPAGIPVEVRYDPVKNPAGVRCSIYDGMRNVFGTRTYADIEPAPVRAFGRSPHDNVGVQYGLEALNAGLLSKERFLDLNEKVGGWNIDFKWRPERAVGDPDAIRIAYETGRVTSGGGGLKITPIIDERVYLDNVPDIHTSYYSFVMRERLIRDNGHADNYVIQRHGRQLSRAEENLAIMDRWLDAIALDASADDGATKVVRAKPSGLVDVCWNDDGNPIEERAIFDRSRIFDNSEGRCNALYPPHAGPRIVAGGPLTSDVLKCQLKPIDPGDYKVTFSDAELNRLKAIFPDGVCDWSKPGASQVPNTRTWLSFGPSPVNLYRD